MKISEHCTSKTTRILFHVYVWLFAILIAIANGPNEQILMTDFQDHRRHNATAARCIRETKSPKPPTESMCSIQTGTDTQDEHSKQPDVLHIPKKRPLEDITPPLQEYESSVASEQESIDKEPPGAQTGRPPIVEIGSSDSGSCLSTPRKRCKNGSGEPHQTTPHQLRFRAILPHPENEVLKAESEARHARDHGWQRILDLPRKRRCENLELLIIGKHYHVFFALAERPEIGEIVHGNLDTLFAAFNHNRKLASELQQILVTTALLFMHANERAVMIERYRKNNRPLTHEDSLRRSAHLAEFLRNGLLRESPRLCLDSPTQAITFLKKYQECLRDADTLTEQFVKITLGNAAAMYTIRSIGVLPRYGTTDLSKVEHHRILRGFLRLQLYTEIRKEYGTKRSFKHSLRGLFSLWTTWEFDEFRSLAEWMKSTRPSLPKAYAKSILDLFAVVDTHFYNDMAPYVTTRPAPTRDRNRRSKFAKRSKKWPDTPATPKEGSANERNRDWKVLGYVDGRFVRFTQRVYREHFLAGGYPFWSRYTEPRLGWWQRRNDFGDLQKLFGLVFDPTEFG